MYRTVYQPLHDDAQAMELVKKFQLLIEKDTARNLGPSTIQPWWVHADGDNHYSGHAIDLNRAIVECAAKMQKTRVPA